MHITEGVSRKKIKFSLGYTLFYYRFGGIVYFGQWLVTLVCG